MTKIPTCTCGENEPGRIIFPCAGQANTGQLSNLAAVELTEEGYGSIACVAKLAIGDEGLVKSAMNADEVVVIDGCPLQCAKKIALAQGVVPAQHVIVTDLGIGKGPSKSYTPDDIETVVSACWRGVGKSADLSDPPGRQE
ncbi:MAG TPA: putative zinc-binding protein [Methanoregulaceae archaeon]|mgnify:CR=1 FL=1|nr:putative zinc-binding protein [Methanoregulaceae archaeon]HQJ88372.1 putative zinc-binding protein [Methanoregulaceae archaeon]